MPEEKALYTGWRSWNGDTVNYHFREDFPEAEYPLWYWFVDDGVRYVFLDERQTPSRLHS